MNLSRFIQTLGILMVVTSSCTKETEKVYTIEGEWLGTYAYIFPSTSPSYGQYMLYVLKPDGSMLVEATDRGATYSAKGNWTLAKDTLTCNYLYSNSELGVQVPQQSKSYFNKKQGTITGTWSTSGGYGTLDMKNIE